MFKVIVTYFDGNQYKKRRFEVKGWYDVYTVMSNAGLMEHRILSVEKEVEILDT